MITFFTSLKPMTGLTAIHQSNAMGSWLAVPDSEILVFGRDAPAPHPRIRHVAEIAGNDYGTPLLDAMFARARGMARHELICFVNGDIILVGDWERIVARARSWREFLLVGRRVNVRLDEELNFAGEWRAPLRELARGSRQPRLGNAIDYFLFRRDAGIKPLAFVIGRPAWDNWMLMDARRRGIDLIEATNLILAVHPRHGYHHVPDRTGERWDGPESDANLALARADQPGFNPGLHTINCANRIAWRFGLLPAWSPGRWRSRRRARRNRRVTTG